MHEAATDVLPVCSDQCLLWCTGGGGIRTGKLVRKAVSVEGDGAGRCGGSDRDEDEREADHGQRLSSSLR